MSVGGPHVRVRTKTKDDVGPLLEKYDSGFHPLNSNTSWGSRVWPTTIPIGFHKIINSLNWWVRHSNGIFILW